MEKSMGKYLKNSEKVSKKVRKLVISGWLFVVRIKDGK
jgi:hypothetical protein